MDKNNFVVSQWYIRKNFFFSLRFLIIFRVNLMFIGMSDSKSETKIFQPSRVSTALGFCKVYSRFFLTIALPTWGLQKPSLWIWIRAQFKIDNRLFSFCLILSLIFCVALFSWVKLCKFLLSDNCTSLNAEGILQNQQKYSFFFSRIYSDKRSNLQ